MLRQNVTVIYDGPDACTKCLGWGHVANDDEGTPWKYWAELPPPSNLAVQMGIVAPVRCPVCAGSGHQDTEEPKP